jgi:hypothetical protein
MKLHICENGKNLTTTVGDLVAELQKLDQALLVYTDGGNAVSITIDQDGTACINSDPLAFDYKTGQFGPAYSGRVA